MSMLPRLRQTVEYASSVTADGDVAPFGNRDGKVDVGDALVALRFALGLVIPTPEDLLHGDVAPLDENGQPNPDGKIDIGDALVILRMALNLVSSDITMPGKGLDLNLNSFGGLFLTAIDDEDLFYSFFGAFDYSGNLQYIEQLVLYQLASDPQDACHYLTIDFDQMQRPVKVILPDLNFEISIEYISDSTTEVTISDREGFSETIEVDNPFPETQMSIKRYNSVYSYGTVRGLEQGTTFIGYVDVCEGETRKPDIWINRKHATSPDHPGVLLIPSINDFNDPEGVAEYAYTYSFNVPNADFDAWRSACIKHKLKSGILMIGGAVASMPIKLTLGIYSIGASILKDANSLTTDHSTMEIIAFALDRVGDKYGGGVSIGAFVKEVGEYLENKGHGPCSLETWEYKRKLEFADQTVYCRLADMNGYEQKEKEFTPNKYQTYQLAPTFTFVCDQNERKVWRLVETEILDDEYELTRTVLGGVQGEIITLKDNSLSAEWYRRVRGCSNHYDLKGSINFSTPPSQADPGEQVTLNVSGELSGYQDCCFFIPNFNYHPHKGSIKPAESLELNLRILQKTMVTIPEEDDERHMGWEGTVTGHKTYTYTFPSVDEGINEFLITGKGNRGLGYSWRYQLQDYN
jgi:hypothetical protein